MWLRGIVAYIVGVPLGAVVMLGTFHWGLAAVSLPQGAVALLALLAVGSLGGVVPLPFPSRRWRVPRRWSAALGHTGYAAAFGFALGLGFVTALPSVSLYAVAASSPFVSTAQLLLIVVVYSVGRTAPLVVAAAVFARGSELPLVVRRFSHFAAALVPVEIALVAMLGFAALFSRLA